VGTVPGMTMPAVFIGHGSPMNTLERNRYTDAWREFGSSMPRPRAILAISAHWFINATAVTAMQDPKTIHDFFGFPDALFAFQYDAPGDPQLASEIVDMLAPTWVGPDRDSWGLDHGTWSVLAHLAPAADIPVVQLSLNAFQPLQYHFEVGAALAPLRDRDVLIMASGNVVHHLGMLDRRLPDSGYGWAVSFDEEARRLMTRSPSEITSLERHAAYGSAVPTPDHFLPLMYLAGLAGAAGATCDTMVEGFAMGSLSMTSYVLR